MRALAIFALLAASASGQVLELTGGQSTVYGAGGAGVRAYLPNQTVYVGAGMVQGRLAFGFSDSFSRYGAQWTIGDQPFGFSLDGGSGLFVQARGISAQKQNDQQQIGAFVGATGSGWMVPYFTGQRAQYLGAGFYFQRRLRNWKLGTLEITDKGRHTAVGAAGYTGSKLRFAAAAGMLASKPTAQGLVQFMPIRALHFSAAHQNLWYENQTATSDSAGAGVSLWRVNADGAAYHGKQQALSVTGYSMGAGVRLGPVMASSALYESAHKTMLMHTATETFRHWNVTQSVSQAAGQTNFSAGGGFHNNRMSVSLSHQVEFLPFAGRGFVQVTAITLSFRIPRTDTAVNLATTILPDGPRYSAGADSWVNGPLHIQGPAGRQQHARNRGAHVIKGTVLDAAGQPVAGAAVQIGRDIVYTDSRGAFFLRVRRAQAIPIEVRPADFTAAGNWQVVAAPAQALPETETKITVKRR